MRYTLLPLLLAGGCLFQTAYDASDARSFTTFFTNGFIDALNGATRTSSTASDELATEASQQIRFTLDSRTSCPQGGYLSVVGDESGSVDLDTGRVVLLTQVVLSIVDCKQGGWTAEGDPYLSLAGTATATGGSFTTNQFTFGGGYRIVGGPSCQVHLTALFPTVTNRQSHLSGTVCGYAIDDTW